MKTILELVSATTTYGKTTATCRLLSGEINSRSKLMLKLKKWRTRIGVPFKLVLSDKEVDSISTRNGGCFDIIIPNYDNAYVIDKAEQLHFY